MQDQRLSNFQWNPRPMPLSWFPNAPLPVVGECLVSELLTYSPILGLVVSQIRCQGIASNFSLAVIVFVFHERLQSTTTKTRKFDGRLTKTKHYQ